ncbi:MAG: hypothetical protein Q4G50_05750 [Corynebacterium sp.]|uniref:hypothetical protein n=1 Tax=Corynebacterium sp. TaxID=1720 RepID=UPI0026E02274|nr:hypothetical protein [Corynebacterium sp.]MDO5669489.1 hypothetical protein [Corynebacterium sp.]
MSTPNDPYEPYPSTPHPEDAPGYGQQPYQGYPQYAGQSSYGEPHYGEPQQPVGDGKVRPMEAVGWAFRATFRNWPVWILGALALMVLIFVTSAGLQFIGGGSADPSAPMSSGDMVIQLLMGVIGVVVGVFIYNGVLREIDNDKIGYGDFGNNVNFWPTLGVVLVLQVLSGVALTLVSTPIMATSNEIAMEQMASQDEMLAELGKLFAVLGVVLLITLLVVPLTTFMPWFAADRRTGFAGAFGAGFRAGARNYLPLLLFTFVAAIATFILTLVTFGLAAIIIVPALTLAQGHMYRQAAQGQLPASPPVPPGMPR